MRTKCLDITVARDAIGTLVSNVENEKYCNDCIPVNIDGEEYNLLLLYKDGNYDAMMDEVKNKFSEKNFDGFFEPSENYVQLSFYKSDNLPVYNHVITFDKSNQPLDHNEIVAFIVDPKFAYIEEKMNKWFAEEETIEIKKSDDIFQFVDSITKKYVKKESFVKRLLKVMNSK